MSIEIKISKKRISYETAMLFLNKRVEKVKNGKKMKGQKLFVPMENKTINVTITDTVFLDKENKRLNA